MPLTESSLENSPASEPGWWGFTTATGAPEVADNLLLQAGPTFNSPHQMTTPIVNSACVVALRFRCLLDDQTGRQPPRFAAKIRRRRAALELTVRKQGQSMVR